MSRPFGSKNRKSNPFATVRVFPGAPKPLKLYVEAERAERMVKTVRAGQTEDADSAMREACQAALTDLLAALERAITIQRNDEANKMLKNQA